MRVKTCLVLACILTSVWCESGERSRVRKAKAVAQQRDKTWPGKYPEAAEGKSTNLVSIEGRKIQSDAENGATSDMMVKVIGDVVSKNSQLSTPANLLPTSNAKPSERRQGKGFVAGPGNVTDPNKICSSFDIRNTVSNLMAIQDCVIIEGFVQIVLFDNTVEGDFENVTFPKLREITGYLLFYRVNGLKSLTNLFPNLEVIRGHSLMTDYALVVYEMPNLQELGLKKLIKISRGGVRIEKNPKLCYVSTINWDRITDFTDNFVKHNNNDSCPRCQHCPTGNCWTAKHCQQIQKPKCHNACLGWCDGPTERDCFVCTHFHHEGRCVDACPPDLYGYLSRRCITKEDCLKLNPRKAGFSTENLTWRPFNGTCSTQCPKNYEDFVDSNNVTTCKECAGPCRKSLPGEIIRNMANAQRYRGIDVIQGGLEIHIQNANRNTMYELAEAFGTVEEITGYLKVLHSFPITNLGFFKKLRLIKGEPPDSNNATLTILDNPNLSNLFAKDQQIEIQNGGLFFHYNPKLCFSKIEELGRMVGIQNFSKVQVDPESNGEKVACDVVNINITVKDVRPTEANVTWNSYKPAEGQVLLGYVVNYMETENRNITIFDSNFCGNNTWHVVDIDITTPQTPDTIHKLIVDLKPYTSYAIYVKTYTSRNASAFTSPVGQSEIYFFRTLNDVPSVPTNVSSVAASDSEILVTWGPPEYPNGPIGYYLVFAVAKPDDPVFLETRDYCKYGLVDEPAESIVEMEFPTSFVTETNLVVDADNRSCCLRNEQKIPPKPKTFDVMLHENICGLGMLFGGKKTPYRLHKCGYGYEDEDEDVYWDEGIPRPEDPWTTVPVMGNYYDYKYNVSANNHSYVLGNLTHYTLYTVSVAACGLKFANGTDQCSPVQYTTTRTSKMEMADDVRNVRVQVTNNTNVMVSWDEITKPNAMTLAFTVEYTNLDVKDAKKLTECVTAKKAQGNRYHIKNLSPGKYGVRVRSTSLAGDGDLSEMVKFVVDIPQNSSTGLVIGLCITIIILAAGFALCLVHRRRQNRMKQIRLIASVNPDYIETSYNIDEWEVPREDIRVLHELGLGNFGMVYKGVLHGTTFVAIKTIPEKASLREKNEFLNEASVMKNFSTFHIIKLLGVVSIGNPPFVIMELMENGDLKTYLRKIRDTNFVPSFTRVCRMAAEIADGMAYLESKKFVHRDLAARNCMVSRDLVCKIGDFGMARDIYETDYYKIGKKGLLPIRWMAPENLSDGVFTSDSDVWSYAVVLYEILTMAEIPYQGFSNEEVLSYVLRKGTVDIPKNCPEVIHKIMDRCFKWRPRDRPTFLEIISELEPFLSQDFCTTSFYHSQEGVEIRNSGLKKPHHNAAPIGFYFGNETARWVKDFEDNVTLLDQTKAGSSRGRIFKNGFQQFGSTSAMEDVSLDR